MIHAKRMMIDNMPVEINGEKNLLELINKTGVKLPTFCYYSELSVYGACRMCMVEDDRGSMQAACSTPPREGMVIYTNTPRLRKYRKNILELLLANHCRDCTTCKSNENCKLQELAKRFGLDDVRFPNTKTEPEIDDSSLSITIDRSKCILCGDCVRMCNEVQNVGAIDFAHRGSKMKISTAFNVPLVDSGCVGCGQCSAVCPTGAITIKYDTDRLWKLLSDKDTKVIVQIAPAVRAGVAKALGVADANLAMGKMVASLRRMGFAEVFDTTTGADLTIVEETKEFIERLSNGGKLPLFTSCCPAWIKYAETKHPELMENISTCRSPMEMFGAVIKEYYKEDNKKVVSVAVMPCTAKKSEAGRKEFVRNDVPDVDIVITTQELVRMIEESGIMFRDIAPEALSMPFGGTSGSGLLFGVTGGVTEAVLRHISDDKSMGKLEMIAMSGIRGFEGVKECTITHNGVDIKIAVVSGLANAERLIQAIQSGEVSYHFVEVMACPGGCVAGAGQPFGAKPEKVARGNALYQNDRMSQMKSAGDNPVLESLYNNVIGDKVHEMLHVHYGCDCHK